MEVTVLEPSLGTVQIRETELCGVDGGLEDGAINMVNMVVVSGGLVFLSLPLAYALRTLIKLQAKKIYPILRLIVFSKVTMPALTDHVSREPNEGQNTSVF